MESLLRTVEQLLQDRFGLAIGVAVACASVVAFYLMRSRTPAVRSGVNIDDQSVEIEPGVRTSPLVVARGSLIDYYYEDAKTTYEAFCRGLRLSENGPMLGTPTGQNFEYKWISYQEAYDRAMHIGSACISKGLAANNDSFVGIYSANCPEWVITQQACAMYSMVTIALYDTLGEDVCNYIINQADIRLVLCDKVSKALSLLNNADKTPSLEVVVVIEEVTDELRTIAHDQSVTVLSFADMEAEGKNNIQKVVPPKPDDVCTICYTSGTTGNPKGVMLTHKNLISNVAAIVSQCPNALASSPSDVHISYLPMAHMLEGIMQLMMIIHGTRIGFARGDVKFLTDDLQNLKPTIFPTVPRLLNRIYDKVMMGVRTSTIKSILFNLAMSRKEAMLKRGIVTKDSIWDKLVFRKIQKLLGDRFRYVVTGSAPLSDKVMNFARCSFGCYVFEGYGQTECTAALALTLENEWRTGHVGSPIGCNHVKLIDVPDMDYYAKDNKGEVCVKGNNVMKGYYKDPEKTAEAIDADGWLHTGDIGQWLPNGTLKIIDRKKHIFKLAQGEYLAPERIEAVYLRSPYVAQAFVDGNSLETHLVGIIVPDPEVLLPWAAEHGLSDSIIELCASEAVQQMILNDLTSRGKESGLRSFEQIKKLHLEPEMFTVANGLLTPTFKSKRPSLRKHYDDIINGLYRK